MNVIFVVYATQEEPHLQNIYRSNIHFAGLLDTNDSGNILECISECIVHQCILYSVYTLPINERSTRIFCNCGGRSVQCLRPPSTYRHQSQSFCFYK